MSGRAALQPALAKLVAFAAVVVVVWIVAKTMGHCLLIGERLGLGVEPPVPDASESSPEPPATREESTRVMDWPELRPGP